MNEVALISLSSVEKKIKLLFAVAKTLTIEPEKFPDFVVVLENSSPTLRDIARKLEETYAELLCQPGAGMSATHKGHSYLII